MSGRRRREAVSGSRYTPGGEDSAVVLSHVGVNYGDHVVIEDLSFSVAPGERLAILGETGIGKSTILHLLSGTKECQQGSVKIIGIDPFLQHWTLRGVVAIAFQTPRLLPWRTALGNVELGMEILGVPRRERIAAATEWLERVGLHRCERLYPHQLSGGMRQRVSLARAFAISPRILLLDEAFSALDEVTAAQLRHDFRDLSETLKMTSIFVTHNVDEALSVAHRVLLLGPRGRVVGEFPVSKLLSASESSEAKADIVSLMADVRRSVRDEQAIVQ